MKKNMLLIFCSLMFGSFYALLITKFGLPKYLPANIPRIYTEVLPFVVCSIIFIYFINFKNWKFKIAMFILSFVVSEISFYITFFLTFDFDLSDF